MNVLFATASDQDDRILSIKKEVFSVLENNHISVTEVSIENIQKCIYCEKCHKTKKCIYEDAINSIIGNAEWYQGLLFAGLSHYGKAEASLHDFMERLFHADGDAFSCKPAAVILAPEKDGVDPDFAELHRYFLCHQVPVVSSYDLPVFHGSEEDFQNIRTLVSNMAWLMSCIHASAIKKPFLEERIQKAVLR